MPTNQLSSLSVFLEDVARELRHQLDHCGNKYPSEIIQRLDEICRELNAAAYQIKRKEPK